MIRFKTWASRRPDWASSTTVDEKHPLDEVLSATIKEIRRGRASEAARWALLMAEAGPEALDFLWESLCNCALEDVGLAEPNAIVALMAARAHHDSLPVGYVARKLAIVFATMHLARSPKSRLADETLTDALQRRDEPMIVPDYALDHHTARGRSMGRDERFFYDVAARLDDDRSFDKSAFQRIRGRVAALTKTMRADEPWDRAGQVWQRSDNGASVVARVKRSVHYTDVFVGGCEHGPVGHPVQKWVHFVTVTAPAPRHRKWSEFSNRRWERLPHFKRLLAQ